MFKFALFIRNTPHQNSSIISSYLSLEVQFRLENRCEWIELINGVIKIDAIITSITCSRHIEARNERIKTWICIHTQPFEWKNEQRTNAHRHIHLPYSHQRSFFLYLHYPYFSITKPEWNWEKKNHSFAGIVIISHTTTMTKKNRGINRIKMYTTQLCSKRVTCNNVQMACNVRHTNRFRNTQQPHANRMMTAW